MHTESSVRWGHTCNACGYSTITGWSLLWWWADGLTQPSNQKMEAGFLCVQRPISDKGKTFNLQTDVNRNRIQQLAKTASGLLFIDTPTVTADSLPHATEISSGCTCLLCYFFPQTYVRWSYTSFNPLGHTAGYETVETSMSFACNSSFLSVDGMTCLIPFQSLRNCLSNGISYIEIVSIFRL
jgi:hypothetical protein